MFKQTIKNKEGNTEQVMMRRHNTVPREGKDSPNHQSTLLVQKYKNTFFYNCGYMIKNDAYRPK